MLSKYKVYYQVTSFICFDETNYRASFAVLQISEAVSKKKLVRFDFFPETVSLLIIIGK